MEEEAFGGGERAAELRVVELRVEPGDHLLVLVQQIMLKERQVLEQQMMWLIFGTIKQSWHATASSNSREKTSRNKCSPPLITILNLTILNAATVM